MFASVHLNCKISLCKCSASKLCFIMELLNSRPVLGQLLLLLQELMVYWQCESDNGGNRKLEGMKRWGRQGKKQLQFAEQVIASHASCFCSLFYILLMLLNMTAHLLFTSCSSTSTSELHKFLCLESGDPPSLDFHIYSITKAFSPSHAKWNQFPFRGIPLVTNGSAVSSTPVYTSPTLLPLIHPASSFTNIKVPAYSNRIACGMLKQQHLFFKYGPFL